MGRGLLVAAFDFSTAHADEFHDWYDLGRIPERKAVPGFGACERWIGDEAPTLSAPPTISTRWTCCAARPTHPLPAATCRSGRSA